MGYTMVISEKKEAAARIATALDDEGTPQQLKEGGVTYFEAKRRGERIFVVSAVGHLYNVTSERKGSFYYPVFNVVWKPVFEINKAARRLEKWIQVFSKIAGGASKLVSGTDFDVEGELIGYTILKYACGSRIDEAKRMAFSTLTGIELRNAFENLLPNINFGLAVAGETRHMVDFLWGVNLSRAITIATKTQSGRYRVLSVGRVQAPTLKFIVDREKAIQSFVPTPYWEITAKIEVEGELYQARYERSRLHSLSEAEAVVSRCSGMAGFVDDVQIRTFKQNPPDPFDLGGLQGEVYNLFRYVPSRTLSLAERLYLDALISYPRTSSQKLPQTIDYREILSSLRRVVKYRPLVEELLSKPILKPHEGKRSDPAHPAIYPTGNLPEKPLNVSYRRIFDLIVRRFLAVFSVPALKQGIRVAINVDGELFYLRGRRVLEKGWLKFYEPYVKSDEAILPVMEAGQRVLLRDVHLEERYTPPPTRYNPNSLLNLMGKEGIGTKATRASIIDKLYKRGYVRDERMEATELGFRVVEALEAYCPRILSVELTKELEGEMARIEEGVLKREEVLERVVNVLKDVLLDFRDNEELIGRALSDAVSEVSREAYVIGMCPLCKSGSLMILRSRKTGKRFVGCSNFRRGLCDASFPLPQLPHAVKPVRAPCNKCGWPRVQVKSRSKRPWHLCLNPDCPSKSRRRRHK
jgi:DNA topoisomerase-1